MGPYYLYTRLPSRCYMLLARPDPKVSLVSQSREWKINMAGVETSEKITAAKNLCLKRTVRPKYGSILAKRKKTFHKFRYCASRTVKLWSRREEIQLISSHLEHNHRELYEDFWKCNAKSTKTANKKPSNNKGDNHRSKFYKCNALRKNIKTSQGCYQTLFS